MELITHAKSVSDYKKSLFFLIGFYVLLGVLIYIYVQLKAATADEFETELWNVPFESIELQQTFEEYEPIPESPPPAEQEAILPVITETDSVAESDTLISAKAAEGDSTINSIGIDNASEIEATDAEELDIEEIIEKGKIYYTVDKMPEFKGGEMALRRYIAQNLKYPEAAYKNGIYGMVFVRFCVTTNGAIDNIKIMKGVNPLLDNEVLRIIKSLPAWMPGEHKGEKVAVWITIPINFQLNQ